MRKMMLLAAMVAIATLMMAAAPAFAQEEEDLPGSFREVEEGVFVKPGACPAFLRDEGEIFTREQVENRFGDVGPNASKFCVIFEDEDNGGNNNGGNNNGGNNNGGNNNGGNNNGGNNNGGNNNGGNNNAVPAFEITQDFEQEAESGDIDQSFDVSQTGDNSNQTVGINGTANTGNLQTQTGFIDAGGFGNFDGNNGGDDERFFFVDDFCDFGDFDGDGICDRLDRLEERFEDRCEDGNNDGFCDRLEERIEDLEDRIDDGGFFFVVDDDSDNERFFGGNDGGDFEFEDIGSELTVSGDSVVTSDQQVNQAATASGK
jgi:hypothetical protein